MKSCTRHKNSQGFTLIEIALALLVVAIGASVLVSLFPAGLQANKVATDETQMAMFADEILSGVKAVASESSWSSVLSGNLTIPTPGEMYWDDAKSLKINSAASMKGTNSFVYRGTSGIPAYAYRYIIDFHPLAGGKVVGVTLTLWNGEYGPLDKGFVFYTEIYYNGK